MLRDFHRCILRLHPPAFRRRFGEEMLSIFDQAPGKRAAVGLFFDAFASLIRQWALRPEFWNEDVSVPVQQAALDGVPSFCSLNPFRPRATAVVPGLVLSIAVFSLTCVAIKYSWIRVLHVRIPEMQFEASQSIPSNVSRPDFSSRGTEPRARNQAVAPIHQKAPAQKPEAVTRAASNAPTQPPVAPKVTEHNAVQSKVSAQSNTRKPNGNEVGRFSPELEQEAAAVLPLTATEPVAFAEEAKLDAAARHRVINGALAVLTKYYVDADSAQKVAAAIRKHEQNGDDNAATDGSTFADLLTGQMRHVSHDKYLAMIYSQIKTPENVPAPVPAADEVERYRKHMQENNCTFEKVEILPHNIGYLKFNSFPDAAICGPTASAAMAKLNGTEAIIFDLRDNPGGYANMVALIATYLFDRPTHLNDFYDRGENSTEESWTLPPVPGNRLADKPAFVLTSATTFSAAEGFSYDLKMLKRATLVGETTSGRGHMGAPHRIDDHFTIRVPGVRVINPISRTNWEGTGVEPDVKVKAADALGVAINLAESKLQK